MAAPKARKQPASKRIVWTEPGREHGGEFRLTWPRLAAIVGTLAAMMGLVPAYWTISDHWLNRIEVLKLLKDHADHDAGVQQWNQYGFASNYLEYLGDKAAECDAKRLVQAKLAPVDVAICARYDAKVKTKTAEAADLKAKAMETTKEKQP